jgi:hypothetical protein
MKVAASVAELQRENIVLELQSIDRMYLNAYVPKLTSEMGIAGYFRGFLGHRFASTKSAAGKSEALVRAIMKFIAREKIALVRFDKGVRKDEIMSKELRKFRGQGECSSSEWRRRKRGCRAPSASALAMGLHSLDRRAFALRAGASFTSGSPVPDC